ncbi:hypothetical protein BaRGS_00028205, partial [Batillaria attramentaria]
FKGYLNIVIDTDWLCDPKSSLYPGKATLSGLRRSTIAMTLIILIMDQVPKAKSPARGQLPLGTRTKSPTPIPKTDMILLLKTATTRTPQHQ